MEKLSLLYCIEKDRVASFKTWVFDENKTCNKLKMAEAGFYWSGISEDDDTVTCFVCGKVLDGWEETDEPWFEHQKHAPQCAIVKLGKREQEMTVSEFVDLFEGSLKNLMTKQYKEEKKYLKEGLENLREKVKKLY